MLKWDNDSPVTFKSDGTTVHDFEERFANEDAQISFYDKEDAEPVTTILKEESK